MYSVLLLDELNYWFDISQLLHGPRKMSRKRQHNSESLTWEYFPPYIDDIDTSVLRCLLESNEPIPNVLSIPEAPQTKRSKFEDRHFWPFLPVHRYLYKNV